MLITSTAGIARRPHDQKVNCDLCIGLAAAMHGPCMPAVMGGIRPYAPRQAREVSVPAKEH